jgi:hypothetical protein
VAGNRTFRETTIRRPPESIALASARDATGQFEFELQQNIELLRPFEGSAVAGDWRFELPRAANHFDFQTIADVLLTIDYTARFSPDFRAQVVERLGRRFSADRAFSLRHELPDQWFDLNNPEQTLTPMKIAFDTRRADFLPNLEELRVEQVVLFFVRRAGLSFEVEVDGLFYTEEGDTVPAGGSATSIDGVISIRRGNASNWIPIAGKRPIGRWELALTDTEALRNRFKDEEIEDILFVITYSALTADWT